jgi:D-glycero-alpha-D-manno-heptose-7-phosphate kinase
MITSPNIDAIYAGALDNGARGGKLLGAGGGGFFIFYVPPFRKHDLMNYLDSCGLKIRQFRFEAEGLQAWSIRETRNHKAKRDI